MQLLLKFLDWAGRVQTLYWLLSSALGVGSLAMAMYLGAPNWAVFLTVVVSIAIVPLGAIAWIAWNDSHVTRSGDDRQRVLAMLQERRSIEVTAMPLNIVTTFWHGSDGQVNDMERVNWNTKLRRLKNAVDDKSIRGIAKFNLDGTANMNTEADINDLIKFFQSHR